jgi:hypothetical protein
MARLIPVYMNDQAREVIRSISENERTYDKIKKALLEEFGTTEEEYFEKFNSAKLEHGVKPKVFAANLEKWLEKGLPDVDRDKREKKLKTKFIKSLPSDLRKMAEFNSEKDWKELIKAVTRAYEKDEESQ